MDSVGIGPEKTEFFKLASLAQINHKNPKSETSLLEQVVELHFANIPQGVEKIRRRL